MPDNFAQLVKQQVDIVKIVEGYLKLRKTGAQNYTGLCPFHKEKTGSFSVNATRGFFYCFGCHEKGDVFTFVMKMDALSFPEAVRAVATKAGIPLPKREFSSPEEAREAGLRRQLIEIHEAATQYFEAQLKSPSAARAREYLTGRGVTPETIATFRIGFAPDDFNDMRDRLKAHFSEEVMRASGLFSSKEQEDGSQGQMYARFRKRITFPIANEQGKPIAFTARALEDVDDKGRQIAKYMNSPETPLYTKGNVLFNLDKAKTAIQTNNGAILVEGQMDCISLYMAGLKSVVATSGTAFTEMQVRLLGRFTKRVMLNFDPDAAGAGAMERSIAMLTEEDFDITVLQLEDGLDPDRYVRERGAQAYVKAMQGRQRYADYLIERARLQFPGRTAEAKVKAMNFLLPHIRRIPNRIQRDEFAADAAQKLGIDSALMRQELKQAAAQKLGSVRSHVADPATEVERVLLRALVQPESDPARALAADKLAENPEWYDGMAAAPLFDALAHGVVPDNPLDAAPDAASTKLLAEVLHTAHDTALTVAEVDGALYTLQKRRLLRRQRELREAISRAHPSGDQAMLEQLDAEKIAVDRALSLL